MGVFGVDFSLPGRTQALWLHLALCATRGLWVDPTWEAVRPWDPSVQCSEALGVKGPLPDLR